MDEIFRLLRSSVRNFTPYSSARSELPDSGGEMIFLDANENSFGCTAAIDCRRYPDPLQLDLKQKLAQLKGIAAEQIFVGNGSDEAIDLLVRAFCEAGQDSILIMPPTFGMYAASSRLNGVRVLEAPLTRDFQLDANSVLQTCSKNTKLCFICSPNNPTGNLLDRSEIGKILSSFSGVVVIDEAYIDFAPTASFVPQLADFPRLVILQTFSKAWGLAGMRLGIALACRELIDILNRIKHPYNISSLVQKAALDALDGRKRMEALRRTLLSERERLRAELQQLRSVRRVYASDANFLLVKMADAELAQRRLLEAGIVVRDRSSAHGCSGCLRITVGAPDENRLLLQALSKLEN